MPIYEYLCQACQHELEKLQKISDAPLVDCPVCGEPRLKKKISAVGFRLSGGGWYETDFKQSDKKKNLAGERDKSDSGAADKNKDNRGGEGKASGGQSEAKKSESKPAKKADSQ